MDCMECCPTHRITQSGPQNHTGRLAMVGRVYDDRGTHELKHSAGIRPMCTPCLYVDIVEVSFSLAMPIIAFSVESRLVRVFR